MTAAPGAHGGAMDAAPMVGKWALDLLNNVDALELLAGLPDRSVDSPL